MRRALLTLLLAYPLSASALWGPPFFQGVSGGGSGGTTYAFITPWRFSWNYEATSGAVDYVYVGGSGNTYVETVANCTSSSIGAGPTGTGTGIADGTCLWNYVAAGSVFVVPSNYTATLLVAAGGGGGGGSNGSDIAYTSDLASGGGGAYAQVTAFSTSAAANINFQAGLGGAGGAADGSNLNPGSNGTASWFNGTTCVGATVCADFGVGGNTAGGTGGLAANSVGSATFSGGNSGVMQNAGAPGGGGAAGPHGAGQSGGNGSPTNPAGGGGGPDNGSAGSAGTTTVGGAGGNNFSGSGGGTGGSSSVSPTPGTSGGGGGGDAPNSPSNIAGNGSCGVNFDTLHGPGGGGGGASAFANDGTSIPGAGFCGGGGGSAAPTGTPGPGSYGGNGFIVFEYTHS